MQSPQSTIQKSATMREEKTTLAIALSYRAIIIFIWDGYCSDHPFSTPRGLAVHPAKTLRSGRAKPPCYRTSLLLATKACLLPSPILSYLYRIYQLLRMDDEPWRRRPAAHSSASLAKTSSSPEAHEASAS